MPMIQLAETKQLFDLTYVVARIKNSEIIHKGGDFALRKLRNKNNVLEFERF
jgi:hypothetical protein